MSSPAARGRMLRDLIAASHVVTLEQVPDMVAKHAARVGWPEVLIYLADLQQDVLCLLAGQGSGAGGGAETVPDELRIEGTLPGRAFQTGSIVAGAASGGGLWWVPLLDGTERLGVLRASAAPDTEWDAQAAQDLRNLAGLVALMVVSKRGTAAIRRSGWGRLRRRSRRRRAAR